MGRLTVYVPSAVLEVVATDSSAKLLAGDLPLFRSGSRWIKYNAKWAKNIFI